MLGLSQLRELSRLLDVFDAAGVRVLLLKGVALSQRLYADPFRRGVGDMDLLIDIADFAAAHAALTENGYARQDGGSPQPPSPGLLALAKDVSYVHCDGHVVELHLRLWERQDVPGWPFEPLWTDRAVVRIQGRDFPTLSDRAQAVYLIAHGARHCWDRLCWLADVAVLFRDGRLRDETLRACGPLGLERSAGHALELMRIWFGGGVGPAMDPARMRWFVAAFFSRRRWLERPRRGSGAWLARELRQRRWRLYLGGNWRHHLDALRRSLRNPVDQALIPLPAGLLWLYPLLRPVGWVIRNFIRRR